MTWQREFVKTFYEVMGGENAAFAKLVRGMDGDVSYPGSVVDLKEREWQFLLFKGLLAKKCFGNWIIGLEQAYSEKPHAQGRKWRADFTLAQMKYGKPDWASQISIEMKRGFGRVEDDYHRLMQNCDPRRRGLLVYRFRKRPVDLEREADELSVFKRTKPIMDTLGDVTVKVVGMDGSHKRYHFAAALLSW